MCKWMLNMQVCKCADMQMNDIRMYKSISIQNHLHTCIFAYLTSICIFKKSPRPLAKLVVPADVDADFIADFKLAFMIVQCAYAYLLVFYY